MISLIIFSAADSISGGAPERPASSLASNLAVFSIWPQEAETLLWRCEKRLRVR